MFSKIQIGNRQSMRSGWRKKKSWGRPGAQGPGSRTSSIWARPGLGAGQALVTTNLSTWPGLRAVLLSLLRARPDHPCLSVQNIPTFLLEACFDPRRAPAIWSEKLTQGFSADLNYCIEGQFLSPDPFQGKMAFYLPQAVWSLSLKITGVINTKCSPYKCFPIKHGQLPGF